jgi:hypothetical protein
MSKNGLILLTPTSIAYTGTSATISGNGSVLFTACSLLSLNGVFTADYDNYIVVCRQSASANSAILCRLRLSGADNSSPSSYVSQILFADSSSVSGIRYSESYGYIGARGNIQRAGFVATIYGPSLAQPTAWRSTLSDDYNTASVGDDAATHNVSTAYDGFTFFLNSPVTMTGRIAVYGMRK